MAKKEPTVIDVLIRMRNILRKGWTQGYYAKTKSGRLTDTDKPNAAKFCLVGARMRAIETLDAYRVRLQVVSLIEGCVPHRENIVEFNDTRGRKKSEVIAVVNCAIKKAKPSA